MALSRQTLWALRIIHVVFLCIFFFSQREKTLRSRVQEGLVSLVLLWFLTPHRSRYGTVSVLDR